MICPSTISPELLGVVADDADAIHLRAGVAAGRRQRIGVDVIHLTVARVAGDVDQLAADRHDRQPRARVHQDAFAAHRRQQPYLGRADDRSGSHGDVAGLDVVAGAPHIGTRGGAAQDPHPLHPAVGPAQRQHRIGQRRQRGAGLHPGRLAGLQPAGGARTGLDGSGHRQDQPAALARVGVFVVVGERPDDTHLTDPDHVDAAHRVAVDRGLIESGQRPFGHHFLGAHQSLRLGDGNTYGPRGYRGGRYPGLLLLHRTHERAFLPSKP